MGRHCRRRFERRGGRYGAGTVGGAITACLCTVLKKTVSSLPPCLPVCLPYPLQKSVRPPLLIAERRAEPEGDRKTGRRQNGGGLGKAYPSRPDAAEAAGRGGGAIFFCLNGLSYADVMGRYCLHVIAMMLFVLLLPGVFGGGEWIGGRGGWRGRKRMEGRGGGGW